MCRRVGRIRLHVGRGVAPVGAAVPQVVQPVVQPAAQPVIHPVVAPVLQPRVPPVVPQAATQPVISDSSNSSTQPSSNHESSNATSSLSLAQTPSMSSASSLSSTPPLSQSQRHAWGLNPDSEESKILEEFKSEGAIEAPSHASLSSQNSSRSHTRESSFPSGLRHRCNASQVIDHDPDLTNRSSSVPSRARISSSLSSPRSHPSTDDINSG